MTNLFSSLEYTIKTDLQAGVSWFEAEAEETGVALWNILKATFIALEPQEAQILLDVLAAAVAASGAGAPIEAIETIALNTVKSEELAVLSKAGSKIVQALIANIKAAL